FIQSRSADVRVDIMHDRQVALPEYLVLYETTIGVAPTVAALVVRRVRQAGEEPCFAQEARHEPRIAQGLVAHGLQRHFAAEVRVALGHARRTAHRDRRSGRAAGPAARGGPGQQPERRPVGAHA
ncbi:MAG: hypothetical protein ACK56I_14685, partial [bacterium]